MRQSQDEFIRLPGAVSRYALSLSPVLDEQGVPILVFQNPVDVTELYRFDERSQSATLKLAPPSDSNTENFHRARMHEALSRILNNEREHLRSLFNQAPGFVAVLMGPRHVFELVNEACYQLVGHRELVGKTVWEALPQVAATAFVRCLPAVTNRGKRPSPCPAARGTAGG